MGRLVLPTLLILAVALAGCFGSKKNPVKVINPPFTYSRSTPQAVLTSLIHAYESRDSVEYAKLYAYDYQGASYDTSEAPGIQPGTFTRADEVAHIKALAEDARVLGVSMDLGPRRLLDPDRRPRAQQRNLDGDRDLQSAPRDQRERRRGLQHRVQRDFHFCLLTRDSGRLFVHRHALEHRAVVRGRAVGTLKPATRAA